MRKIFSYITSLVVIVGLLLAGVLFINEHYINAKTYDNQEVVIYARVLPDGSLKIREERTVKFSGEFSRYSLQFPFKGYSGMTDFAVAEQAGSYNRVNSATDRPSGKFTVTAPSGGKGDYKIEWYFRAKDEIRKFIIDYRVLNCVTVYQDVAELYWQFVGAKRDETIGRMLVFVTLPPGAARDQIKVWGHGPLSGQVSVDPLGNISMVTTKLPPNRFMEGRVVFPTGLVPQATKKVNQVALAGIQKQETEFERKTAEEHTLAQMKAVAEAAIPAAGIGLASWLYWRYGRRYKPEFAGDYYRELPGEYSPAELSILYYPNKQEPSAMSATLMDLARRGYIRMEPVHWEEKRLGGLFGTADHDDVVVHCLRGADASLREHEVMLLGFLFNDVGGGQSFVAFSALRQYGKDYAKQMKQFVDDWFNSVRRTAARYTFFDRNDTFIKSLWLLGLVVLLVLGTLFCLGTAPYREFAPSVGLTALAFGLLYMVGRKPLRSAYGETQYAMWQAFRKFLTDFSNLDRAQIPQLILWEYYLVFAVVLGVAREVLRQLPVVYPQIQDPESEFGRNWGYYGSHQLRHDHRSSDSAAGWAGFGTLSLLDSMQQTWGTAFASAKDAGQESSSSGSGGGFSSGGGGGGGGSSSSAD